MKQACDNEKTLRQRFVAGNDLTIVCLMFWFAIVALMLLVDISFTR
jgi:hypothetical protein